MDSDGEIRLALANQSIRIDDCPRWIGQLDKVHHFSGLELLFVWLAPEVLRQDLNGYGLKSDLYSFGICLCELANGIAPFTEMEPLQILYEKLHGTTPFLLDSTTCGLFIRNYPVFLKLYLLVRCAHKSKYIFVRIA
jgi:hypothetical protein